MVAGTSAAIHHAMVWCHEQGKVLASLQLVQKGHLQVQLPPPPPINPPFRKAYLEIICVGVRHLKPFMLIAAQKPLLKFHVPRDCNCSNGCRDCRPYQTHASSRPNGPNANILHRVMMPILVPNDPRYVRSRERVVQLSADCRRCAAPDLSPL